MNKAACEQALTFECEGETLVGILHRPAPDAPPAHSAVGVVVIVGGPQYRAGSHRQFVHLARALAAAGHPVLRFDVQGMGDSTGALRSFEQLTPDIRAAIETLQRHVPSVKRVALWGLCDGASAALLYLDASSDPRVCTLFLLNPWVRSSASLARTRVKHYYTRRLRQREFWAKLCSGRVASSALRELATTLLRTKDTGSDALPIDTRTYQRRMADAWRAFGGEVVITLSGNDYTAKEFLEYVSADPMWQRLLSSTTLVRQDLPGADHTLSTGADKQRVINLTVERLGVIARSSGTAVGAHDAIVTPRMAQLQ